VPSGATSVTQFPNVASQLPRKSERLDPADVSNLSPRVCTENLIRVDDVMESPKLAE